MMVRASSRPYFVAVEADDDEEEEQKATAADQRAQDQRCTVPRRVLGGLPCLGARARRGRCAHGFFGDVSHGGLRLNGYSNQLRHRAEHQLEVGVGGADV